MKRFVEGEDRQQATLLPACLDDYVTEDNPVRVIDVFIDELDLEALGFAGVVPEVIGRPAYHPATLLKIYLYGYLNRIQSRVQIDPHEPPGSMPAALMTAVAAGEVRNLNKSLAASGSVAVVTIPAEITFMA